METHRKARRISASIYLLCEIHNDVDHKDQHKEADRNELCPTSKERIHGTRLILGKERIRAAGNRAEALLMQRPDYASLEDALDEAVQMVIKNKRIVYHLYRSADRALVEMYLMRICEQVILSYIHDNRSDLPVSPEDKTIIVRYYKCQCFGMIIDWLNSDMRFDIAAEARRMYELRKGMLEEIVRRASMQRSKA